LGYKPTISGNLFSRLTTAVSKIPADFVPTFDDIQSLQSIITQDSIVCSSDFQTSIEKLKGVPLTRLILELMNIPMEQGALTTKCGDKLGKPLSETASSLLTPVISSEVSPSAQAKPSVKGGTRRKGRSYLRRTPVST
jgi:hypothetical protein